MKSKKAFDVIGFGTATLDYICFVDNISDFEKYSLVKDLQLHGGGCVPTAFAALQRLGGTSAFATTLGNDWIGKFILEGLEKENIDCSSIEFCSNISSPFSFVQVDIKSGKRAITYNPGSTKMLKFKDSYKDLIKSGNILFIDGLIPRENQKFVEFAKENNIEIMIDAHIWLDGTDKLLRNIDYLISPISFIEEYTRSDDIDYSIRKVSKDFNPKTLVVTLGDKGAVTIKDNAVIYVDGFNIDAKDTTGAGDVFHGAFLFGLTKKWDLIDMITFSSAVSAVKCMKGGGREGIPDYNGVISFLKKHNMDTTRFR